MLIRVFEIPPPTGKFHFSGGEAQCFVEVDWFRDDNMPDMPEDQRRAALIEFVQGKRYAASGKPLLILHPKWSCTLNYEAP